MSNISDTRFACQVGDYMSTTLDNKIYITGGYNLVCNATSAGCLNDTATRGPIANNDLLVIDFTKQFTWDPRNVGSRFRLPKEMPDVRWGTLWGVGGKLYQFGGEAIGLPAEMLYGEPAPEPRPSVGRGVWEYDIASGVWENTPQKTEWGGVVEPVAQGADACGDGDVCYLLIGRTPTEMNYNGSLLAYNVKRRTWLDMSDVQGSMERVYGARMIYMKALESLVVVGGVTVGSNVPRDMAIISLFHIPRKTWYTIETNSTLDSRANFCAAGVSAEDGSSHHIYIFGGTDVRSKGATPSYSSDIPSSTVSVFPPTSGVHLWVLSMPAFIYTSVTFIAPGRERLSCALIDKRYLVTFSGTQRPNRCDTSQIDGVMRDVSADRWTGLYQRPAGEPTFRVPKELYERIGGTEDGGATFSKPTEGFLDENVKSIFEKAAGTGNLPTSTGAIAGGVVGGLVAVVMFVLVLWWIKRRWNKSNQVVDPPELYHSSVMGQHEEMAGEAKVEAAAEEVAGELDSAPKYEAIGSTPVLEMEGSAVEVEDPGRETWRSR